MFIVKHETSKVMSMATGEEFCKFLSNHVGQNETALRNLLKELRRDGVLPMGVRGGGRNMPQMTDEHCAIFLIALCGSTNAKEGGKAVDIYGSLFFSDADEVKTTLKEEFQRLINLYRSIEWDVNEDFAADYFHFLPGVFPVVEEHGIDVAEDRDAFRLWGQEVSKASEALDEKLQILQATMLTTRVSLDSQIFIEIAKFLGDLDDEAVEE